MLDLQNLFGKWVGCEFAGQSSRRIRMHTNGSQWNDNSSVTVALQCYLDCLHQPGQHYIHNKLQRTVFEHLV